MIVFLLLAVIDGCKRMKDVCGKLMCITTNEYPYYFQCDCTMYANGTEATDNKTNYSLYEQTRTKRGCQGT